jgi:hypothetical protein
MQSGFSKAMQTLTRQILAAVLLAVVLLPLPVGAQSCRGSIRGKVEDASGRLMAAEVNAKSITTEGAVHECFNSERNLFSDDLAGHSDGCGPVKSEQHGFCTGLNSMSSTRVRSGS